MRHHTLCNEIRRSDFESGPAPKFTDGSAANLSLGELGYRQGADGGQDDPVGGIGTERRPPVAETAYLVLQSPDTPLCQLLG